MKNFEYTGVWWLPESPKNQLVGTLTFKTGQSAQLKIIGSFDSSPLEIKLKSIPVVEGYLFIQEKQITLHNLLRTNIHHFSSGKRIDTYSAENVYIGAHFSTLDSARFNRVYISFSFLDEWVNIFGITYNNKGLDSAVINFELPSKIVFSNIQKYCISINFDCNLPIMIYFPKEVNIKQSSVISIESEIHFTIETVMPIINCLQKFIAIGVIEPVNILDIYGETSINSQRYMVKYYSKLINKDDDSKYINPDDLFFNFREISDRCQSIYNKWSDKFNQLNEIIDLYYDAKYGSNLSLSFRFLSLMQAIESFHRRCIGSIEIEKAAHKKRINDILSYCPIEHKKWLIDKLAFSNELTLKMRFNEIFDKFIIVQTVVKDRMKFIKEVVAVRNYLTHYNERLKLKVPTQREIAYLVCKLQFLFEVLLIDNLGFNDEEQQRILFKDNKYKYQLLDEYHEEETVSLTLTMNVIE